MRRILPGFVVVLLVLPRLAAGHLALASVQKSQVVASPRFHAPAVPLVRPGAVRLDVVLLHKLSHKPPRQADGSDPFAIGQIAAALNRLPPVSRNQYCAALDNGDVYRLTFGYARGTHRVVTLGASGCPFATAPGTFRRSALTAPVLPIILTVFLHHGHFGRHPYRAKTFADAVTYSTPARQLRLRQTASFAYDGASVAYGNGPFDYCSRPCGDSAVSTRSSRCILPHADECKGLLFQSTVRYRSRDFVIRTVAYPTGRIHVSR